MPGTDSTGSFPPVDADLGLIVGPQHRSERLTADLTLSKTGLAHEGGKWASFDGFMTPDVVTDEEAPWK